MARTATHRFPGIGVWESSPAMMEAGRPICLYCSGAIGVYEPVVLVEHDRERETSLAREPELTHSKRALLIHVACAPEGWRRKQVGQASS